MCPVECLLCLTILHPSRTYIFHTNLIAIMEAWLQNSDSASPTDICHGEIHWTRSPNSPFSIQFFTSFGGTLHLSFFSSLRVVTIYWPSVQTLHFPDDSLFWNTCCYKSWRLYNPYISIRATSQLLNLCAYFNLTQWTHTPTLFND